MCLLLLGVSVCIIVVSSGHNLTKYGAHESIHLISSTNMISMLAPIHNQTYIEKSDNMIRIPLINQMDEHRNRKYIKKTPKRIIQKIIKKNRSRPKKFYVYHVTSRPTMQPMVDVEKMYAQEEQSQWKDESTTTQSHQKKKNKRWNTKLPRYPMPFQKLQFKKDTSHKRNRREVRDDVFIFKDLDEMEFLSENDDYNVVNAHVKNYW